MSSEHDSTDQHIFQGLGDTPRPAWLSPGNIQAMERAESLPFPAEEYAARIRRLREQMTKHSIAAMIVFRPSSVEYLCGYHSAETIPQPLVVTSSELFLYVPDLELGRAAASSCASTVLYYGYADASRNLTLIAEHILHLLPSGARVAIEHDQATTPPRIVEMLGGMGATVVDGGHAVERLRLVLSPAEIACVEKAASVTELGVDAAVEAAQQPGATDSSVAGAIGAALYASANSPSAWGPVVATGLRGGVAHSSWKRSPLGPSATLLEFAGAHHRYHAPVMRTVCRGRPPADVLRLAELSRTALETVLETARPGVACADVARQAEEAIGTLDDDVIFHHIFGYPVGLAHPPHWMDGAPFHITANNTEPLREGMVFHVPASFRCPGVLGVGLSQTFVIEEAGARVLTHGPAELIEL